MAKDLVFFKENDCVYLKKISSKEEYEEKFEGFFIDCNGDEKETRKVVDFLKNKKKVIVINGYDNVFNRRVLETMKIDYLANVEVYEKKDNLKQRDSGLNHVLAKIAKKKGIGIVIDLNGLRKLDSVKKALRISRIIQNIKVCRKAGCELKIASFAKKKTELVSVEERKNFLLSLGSDTKQAKICCDF